FPVPSAPMMRRGQPASIAGFDDAMTDLERRTDHRRFDHLRSLPRSTAVVATQQQQVHGDVAKIRAVHEPFFGIIAMIASPETDDEPFRNLANPHGMRTAARAGIVKQRYRVAPRAAPILRARDVRAIVEAFNSLP